MCLFVRCISILIPPDVLYHLRCCSSFFLLAVVGSGDWGFEGVMYLGLQLVYCFALFWGMLAFGALRLVLGEGRVGVGVGLKREEIPCLCHDDIIERSLPSSETC